ncbi:hypothetical protein NXC14_CH01031 [Rhizobium sp. NXC14]|nr:hypothetical protein NXC14_CH01031 [Rhizobium sp. NXC14]
MTECVAGVLAKRIGGAACETSLRFVKDAPAEAPHLPSLHRGCRADVPRHHL